MADKQASDASKRKKNKNKDNQFKDKKQATNTIITNIPSTTSTASSEPVGRKGSETFQKMWRATGESLQQQI